MTSLLKRSFEPSPDAPALSTKKARYDLLDGGIPAADDVEARADALAIAATSNRADDLDALIAGASVDPVELALDRLVDEPSGLKRLCLAITSATRPSGYAIGRLLYRTARQGLHEAVTVLIVYLCEEDEIASALSRAVDKDDSDALQAILEVCASDWDLPVDSYRRLARDALYEAADREEGGSAIVDYLAGICEPDDIEAALDCCRGPRREPSTFKALWKHAGLCAHAYIEHIGNGPAREYLWRKIERRQRCRGDCTSDLLDDQGRDADDEEYADDTEIDQDDDQGAGGIDSTGWGVRTPPRALADCA